MIDLQPTRSQLLRIIRERGGVTLRDLQQATGLSRSTLRQHLTILQRDGAVRERLLRGRPGRPPIVYEPSPAAPRRALESYAAILGAVLRVVGGQGTHQVRRIAEAAAVEIARRHAHIATLLSLEDRITAALGALLEDARTAEVRPVGRDYEVVLRDCPLLALAGELPQICGITRELLHRLTGATVEQRRWMLRGDPCCSFLLKAKRAGRRSRAAPGRREDVRPDGWRGVHG
ncbi:MAG: winged helix-turn-helix transcriptional regulator [Armatimonadota bacterium]|nr:winged helix-turn-helix transcriptional regulator [Armatimonadota bacterium]MDR7464929.1 winged helix-turn-helix transcriptional regulator [Armatimonadota bacterium]MDR7474511.1 winged helix-turn-helix transcriptional regulator [Armatimonadota bacterium]MDR7539834.1 winged helix-turn-helix transcriptional regulator [Armatimonadota bacterium]